MSRPLTLILIAVLFAGCASSPYTYHVTPTPLKSGETKYRLEDVNVNLTLGHGANPGDTTFASQETLNRQFTEALRKHLEAQDILADSANRDAYSVTIDIDYMRTFNYGGNSLNRPVISHSIEVHRDGQLYSSFATKAYAPKYSGLKQVAVDFQIASFNRGAEDEIEDVDLVSQLIARDLAELGD